MVQTWWDAVVASAPMASLATGLGLGGAGYAVQEPGVAASGAVVCAAGLYVERLQARSLRRRRRAERLRSRHEVTELRRTIAQLREDVDAFQRALVDTGAVLAARSLPMLPAVPAPVAAPVAAPADPAVPVAAPVARSRRRHRARRRAGGRSRLRRRSGGSRRASCLEADVVVVPLADVEATEWVQTRSRRPLAQPPLPSQAPSPFVHGCGRRRYERPGRRRVRVVR